MNPAAGNFSDSELVRRLAESYSAISSEIGRVVIGQKEIIGNLLVSLFADGHCLLVGVPGLAKTLLIRTLAEVLDLQFNRIQFTPDLMPGDITGSEIIDTNSTGSKSFRFIKGPVFANIVLADEINRTPPKTQSALLEAMQEHKVTTSGQLFKLPEPFFVLATQNPIEQEGTYPLPEAQLDRFMFSLWLEYPSYHEEVEIVKTTTSGEVQNLKKVLTSQEILDYQKLIRRVPVSDSVVEYAVKIVSATRPASPEAMPEITKYVNWGAGPRASQYLILAAKTMAVLDGRFTPSAEDVKKALP